MAANTSIDLVGLDFATLKSNLKNFLKTNTQFKDVDFEGSNINVLLNLLAYNTYLNAYYTNMVASEMFLDTAQLRDSVVSHAKELNYIPRSFNSAKANITVDVTPSTSVLSVVVPQYTSFTSRVGSNTYTFSTDETYVISESNNGVFSLTADVFEGSLVTESFIVNRANTAQQFLISNRTVDIASIAVTVYEDSGDTELTYTRSDDLFNISETSQVFFLQGAQNSQYEIVFGDDVFGRRPKDGAVVVAKYRATSGELPNGARIFAVDGPIDGHSNISITTVSAAVGGAIYESVDSIKYNAPRAFQAQSRAVTENDYEVLLANKFPDIQSISAYGGETVDPPAYGKVFVSVDVKNTDGTPVARMRDFYNFIKTKTPVSIDVEFVNPEFSYLKINSTVTYNGGVTRKTSADIKSLAQAAISNYNNTTLEKFKATMFFSGLTTAIDQSDTSILSNDTSVFLVKRVIPETLVEQRIVTVAGNQIQNEPALKIDVDEPHYGHGMYSSAFVYNDTRCILVDDTLGNVFIAASEVGSITIIKNVGTISYDTGRVVLPSFTITSYEGNYIEFVFRTLSKNISGSQNTILKIDPLDVVVDAVAVNV